MQQFNFHLTTNLHAQGNTVFNSKLDKQSDLNRSIGMNKF